MLKKSSIGKIVFIIGFCFCILFFSVSNIKTIFKVFQEADFSFQNVKETAQNIELNLKEDFKYRDKLIELYGISLNLFDKNIVGNFEYVKDPDGVMQRFENKADTGNFQLSLLELKEYLNFRNTPLVYINLPDKSYKFNLAQAVNFTGKNNKELVKFLKVNNFDIIDVQSKMSDDSITKTDFFFKTDVHLTTRAEFWMSSLLVNHLSNEYGLVFPNKNIVFDLSQYQITPYKFIGNTARSSGEWFSGYDIFELYLPLFPTEMTLIDKNQKETRAGNFTSVVMNGYENRNNISKFTYWITNYGQYPQPYYRYENNLLPDAPRLLVIADSLFMRGISFLSLASSSLAVVDIRYMKDVNYVEHALNMQDYDAVIICGSSNQFISQGFIVSTQIPKLPERPLQTADFWIGNGGNCIEKLNNETVKNMPVLTIASDVEKITLQGWSIDFQNARPLSALYLQVGDYVVECSYGINRPSIMDYFQNENYEKVGFQVSFPSSYLNENDSTQIQFIQISADGSYRYQPISYEVIWS